MEARAIEIMLDRQVDAIVYATMSHQVVEPPAALRDVRAVLLGARTADASLPSVVPDEVAAARSAVETLVEHGHRRIGWVTTAEPGPATFERLAGYRRVLEERGLSFDPSLVAVGVSGDTHSGLDAAGRLLDRPDRPTALFCFNDRMAMGAYRAIRQRGLRVPQDVSVVGFDNMEQIAPWLDPPLTTMQLPHYEMGRWAVEHVLTEPGSEGKEELPPQRRMSCPRIDRASVAAPSAVTA
jgi:LacI family transcriptional regulator